VQSIGGWLFWVSLFVAGVEETVSFAERGVALDALNKPRTHEWWDKWWDIKSNKSLTTYASGS